MQVSVMAQRVQDLETRVESLDRDKGEEGGKEEVGVVEITPSSIHHAAVYYALIRPFHTGEDTRVEAWGITGLALLTTGERHCRAE